MSRCRLSFYVLLVVLSFLVACQPSNVCQTSDDCSSGQQCHPSKQECVPRCNEDDDCIAGEACDQDTQLCVPKCSNHSECSNEQHCDLLSQRCKKLTCPQGATPVNQRCPCQSIKDCPSAFFCDADKGQSGFCQASCIPGGAGPSKDGCSCPKGWEWVGKQCRKQCPDGMLRGKDNACFLDQVKLAPAFWERGPDGDIRQTCPEGWVRTAPDQPCSLPLWKDFPEPQSPKEVVLSDLKQVGPNKACPTSSSDKWDEAYVSRNKLPPQTTVLYVDAAASAGGSGTKGSPLQSLAKAIQQAPSGAVILIAPGSYPWGLKVSKAIHLVGSCTDGVKIQAQSTSTGSGIEWTVPAHMEGVGLDGKASNQVGEGLVLNQGGELRHIRVENARGTGISASNGTLTLVQSEMTTTRTGGISGSHNGSGLYLYRTRNAVAQGVRLFRNASSGLRLSETQDVTVSESVFEKNAKQGVDATLTQGNTKFHDCRVVGNGATGLYLGKMGSITISSTLVRENGFSSGGSANSVSTIGVFCGPLGNVKFVNNRVAGNASFGVVIYNSNKRTIHVDVVGNTIINNGKSNSRSVGLTLDILTGSMVVRNNQVVGHSSEGMRLARLNATSVIVEGNEFRANGRQSITKGGIYALDVKVSGELLLRSNRVLEHPTLGIAMTNVETRTWNIHGNWFARNNQTNYSKPIGHIQLTNGVGSLSVRGNVIRDGAHVGIYSNKHAGNIEVAKNYLYNIPHVPYKEKPDYPGIGISILRPIGNVVVVGNSIRKAMMGISLSDVSERYSVRFEGNRIDQAEVPFACGVEAISIQRAYGSVQVSHNAILNYIGDAIYLTEIPGVVTVEGNFFQASSRSCLKYFTATNPTIATYYGNLTFRNNRSISKVSATANVIYLERLKWENNVVLGEKDKNSSTDNPGLRIAQNYRPPHIVKSIFRGYSHGLQIANIQLNEKRFEKDKLLITQSLFSNNRVNGVLLQNVALLAQIRGNLLEDNHGVHIKVQSSKGPIVIEESGFSNATVAQPDLLRGQVRDSGVGVWAGATGKVLWVFAKAKDACPVQGGQAMSGLAEGWSMRAVRVPSGENPCLRTVYSTKQTPRTQVKRREDSLCQPCYAQNKGCRWVWEEAGVGASKGEGLWKPAANPVLCVDRSLPDTCENPISMDAAGLKPALTLSTEVGQCRKLSEPDPCKALNHCASQSGTVCIRTSRMDPITRKAVVKAACVQHKHTLVKYCESDQNQPVCGEGTTCINLILELVEPPAIPSNLSLRSNIFWNNTGPDVLLDMAGKISLEDNLYLFCPAGQKGCEAKFGFRKKILREDGKTKVEWEKVSLPTNASVLWQNPSPYPAPYQSMLEGNDLFRTIQGQPLLWRPSLCQNLNSE